MVIHMCIGIKDSSPEKDRVVHFCENKANFFSNLCMKSEDVL